MNACQVDGCERPKHGATWCNMHRLALEILDRYAPHLLASSEAVA